MCLENALNCKRKKQKKKKKKKEKNGIVRSRGNSKLNIFKVVQNLLKIFTGACKCELSKFYEARAKFRQALIKATAGYYINYLREAK
jgi:hypothetical protein